MQNHHVAVRVITDMQTKQYTGITKYKNETSAERQPRYRVNVSAVQTIMIILLAD
jgi:hypothetical protein